MKRLLSLLTILTLLGSLAPVGFDFSQKPNFEIKTAHAAQNGGFLYKKQITYDTSANGANISTNQNYFPIAVHINSSSWPTVSDRQHFFGSSINNYNPGGKRIRFYDYEGTTNLPYEVEYFSRGSDNQTDTPGEAVYWVRIPTVYQSGDANYASHHFIWVAYGNDPDGTDYHGYADYPTQQHAVWNENGAGNFKGVWHLGDNSWGTTPEAKDSTSNGFDFTDSATGNTTGIVRQGRSFDGSSSFLYRNDTPALDITGDMTIAAWGQIGATQAPNQFVGKEKNTNDYNAPYMLHVNSNNKPETVYGGGGSSRAIVTSPNAINLGSYYYLVSKITGTTAYINVNGISKASGAFSGTRQSNSNQHWIGKYETDTATKYLNGSTDEVRISNTARSDDWIKLEYYSMAKTAYNGDNGAGSGKFITHGVELPGGAQFSSIFQTSDTDFNGANSQTSVANNSVALTQNSIVGTYTHNSDGDFSGGNFGSPAYTQVDTGQGRVMLKLDNSTTIWDKAAAYSSLYGAQDTVSLVIGSDGYGRISYKGYYGGDASALRFLQCTNMSCSTNNNTLIYNNGIQWRWVDSSLTIGSDGYARMFGYENYNAYVFVQCTNTDCSTNNITTVDAPGGDWNFFTSSMAMGTDNYARISYYMQPSGDLKYAQCTNAACSTKNITTIDSTGDVGLYSSMALASDGFARISYYDTTNGDLKFAQCTNAACSTKNITTVDSTGNVGQYTSLALDSNNYALISYYDVTNGDLKYVQCTNAACSTKNITTIDSTGDVGQYTSIAKGTDGFARISYYDVTNGDLKYIQCTNAACSTNNISTIDSTGNVGQWSSLKLDGSSNNYGRIAYNDVTNKTVEYAYSKPGYYSSGTYTYYVDSAQTTPTWSSFNFLKNASGGTTTLKVQVASKADTASAPTFTDGGNCDSGNYTTNSTYTSGDISACAGSLRYLWYKVTFTASGDALNTPYLEQFQAATRVAFSPSGFYVSPIIQRAQVASWGNLTYSAPNLNGQGLGIKVRTCQSSDSGVCDGYHSWSGCSAITSGHALSEGGCISNNDKYIQYQANFTSDGSNTAYLDDITLDYFYNPDTSIVSGIVKFFGSVIFK